MRILLDGRLYGLENAGLGRYSMELIQGLAKIDSKNDYNILLRKKYFGTLRLPGNWKKVLADIRHYSLREQLVIPKIIAQSKPDICHFTHFNVPYLYKGPFVVTIHDILMHRQKGLDATTLTPLLYLAKRMGYHRIFARAVRDAIKIIAPSNTVKAEILNYYQVPEGKVEVVYEGATPFKEEKNEKDVLKKYGLSADYFVYAGNAYPHKNLKRAIEAIVSLNKLTSRGVIFAITSSRGVFSEKLNNLVAELKAESQVRLLGFVPDEDLGILYRCSKGFFFPTLSEGFGLPGLEAMLAGTLVLASDIPVLKEIYGPCALYFNPMDFSSMERVLEEAVFMKEEERSSRIAVAKDFASRYSWSKMAKQTLAIYESCARLRQG